MRTTLDIADDVIGAARERAGRERKTLGEMVTELARRGLSVPMQTGVREAAATYGFRPFPNRGKAVTNELIDQLRDEEA